MSLIEMSNKKLAMKSELPESSSSANLEVKGESSMYFDSVSEGMGSDILLDKGGIKSSDYGMKDKILSKGEISAHSEGVLPNEIINEMPDFYENENEICKNQPDFVLSSNMSSSYDTVLSFGVATEDEGFRSPSGGSPNNGLGEASIENTTVGLTSVFDQTLEPVKSDVLCTNGEQDGLIGSCTPKQPSDIDTEMSNQYDNGICDESSSHALGSMRSESSYVLVTPAGPIRSIPAAKVELSTLLDESISCVDATDSLISNSVLMESGTCESVSGKSILESKEQSESIASSPPETKIKELNDFESTKYKPIIYKLSELDKATLKIDTLFFKIKFALLKVIHILEDEILAEKKSRAKLSVNQTDALHDIETINATSEE